MAMTAGMRFRTLHRAAALPAAVAVLFAAMAALPVPAAELQPRSYAYLLSHASLVAAGKVKSVSTGFLSDGRKAVLGVEGLFKGKVLGKEIEIAWKDAEFEETAYRENARVIVFLNPGRDSLYAQVSPGISCWPVEKIALQGKPTRAVEYAYPMDLLTGVPASVIRETETVEKSMNFQVSKRKQWILPDRLLPRMKPLAPPKKAKPKPPRKRPA